MMSNSSDGTCYELLKKQAEDRNECRRWKSLTYCKQQYTCLLTYLASTSASCNGVVMLVSCLFQGWCNSQRSHLYTELRARTTESGAGR